MDIDFVETNTIRQIKDTNIFESFPFNDEAKEQFMKEWMKNFKKELQETFLQSRVEKLEEDEEVALYSNVEQHIVSEITLRKKKSQECAKAMEMKCKATTDHYARILDKGNQLPCLEIPIKKAESNLDMNHQSDLEHLNFVCKHVKNLKESVKLTTSKVSQAFKDLETAKELNLFEESSLDKKLFRSTHHK